MKGKKRVTLAEMCVLRDRYGRHGKRVVLAIRFADHLNLRHVDALVQASEKGNVLLVAATGNAASLIGTLDCVDHFVVLPTIDLLALQSALKPDVFLLEEPVAVNSN
jgi:hypothetical protein